MRALFKEHAEGVSFSKLDQNALSPFKSMKSAGAICCSPESCYFSFRGILRLFIVNLIECA